jgi:hypothetical protein
VLKKKDLEDLRDTLSSVVNRGASIISPRPTTVSNSVDSTTQERRFRRFMAYRDTIFLVGSTVGTFGRSRYLAVSSQSCL